MNWGSQAVYPIRLSAFRSSGDGECMLNLTEPAAVHIAYPSAQMRNPMGARAGMSLDGATDQTTRQIELDRLRKIRVEG
jgi:hypothetical protein